MITVAYMTSRLDPKIEWFLDAFHTQTSGGYHRVRLVIVDFYRDDPSRSDWSDLKARIKRGGGEVFHVEPKPTVWQGKHRLTSQDYFAASNARNTALCLAPDGHIVYVDDLSVPLPTWWNAVLEACQRNNTVTCGAYQKVLELKVDRGAVTHFKEHEAGKDIRMRHLQGDPPYACGAQWHFGCSVAAPTEAYLSIGGWPEACDGLAYEDCITGITMERNGWHFKYDTRMMTYESEELHSVGKPMRRWDKGTSPNDKSHAMLRMFSNVKFFPNYFEPPGIRTLREKTLRGEPFPICQIPEHDWYDGQPLREM